MYRIGVDVGGTFTDLVLLRADGSVLLEKTPTTPRDQSEGVMDGLGRLADGRGARGRSASSCAAPTRSCTAPPPATTR